VIIRAAGRTDKGYVRTNNEDGFFIDNFIGLFAVADGMGGHRAGEIASKVTLEALSDIITREQGQDPERSLGRALQAAGLRISRETENAPELRGMGTTLTGMLLQNKVAYVVHVGDSRCYRLRADKLEMLTEDHSWVWEQRKLKLISDADMRTHAMRNVITRSVGHGGESNPDIFSVETRSGDVFMLCSDGLCGYVEDDVIEATLRKHGDDPQAAANALIDVALEAGGEDNVTIVVIRIE
jgi:PPM family protein phosphatase